MTLNITAQIPGRPARPELQVIRSEGAKLTASYRRNPRGPVALAGTVGSISTFRM